MLAALEAYGAGGGRFGGRCEGVWGSPGGWGVLEASWDACPGYFWFVSNARELAFFLVWEAGGDLGEMTPISFESKCAWVVPEG